jgi:hypothetical protein
MLATDKGDGADLEVWADAFFCEETHPTGRVCLIGSRNLLGSFVRDRNKPLA